MTVSEHVWIGGGGLRGGGVGGSYQPGVYVPLKALFLVNSPEYWVIPRKQWLSPYMTEKLLTGSFNLHTN